MQVVDYRAGVDGPATILVGDAGEVRREALAPGTTLAYTLGERHCAGTVDGDRHLACTNATAPYCEVHTDRFPCARCRGDCALPLESCREEHAVYLAAFAPDAFKVGVTRSWRLTTRLREQGADRGAHLRTVENGRIARQIEADIAETVGDSVRVARKIAGLGRSVDATAWQDLLAEYEMIETYDLEYGLDLQERPVAETLLTGSVVGTKGRVLVLERDGSTYAVDLRELVGYEIEAGATERDLQASLGSFE